MGAELILKQALLVAARFLLVLVLAAAGVLVLLWLGQRRLIYLPSGPLVSPRDVGLAAAGELTVHTRDGVPLGAWFVPPAERSPRGTIIVFNGNAGNRAYRAPLAQRLSGSGYAVCLFDYRGYGGNPGSPTEQGLLEDARAVRNAIAARPGVDASRIVYLGESLGTGVAVALASESAPAALVLRSPFTSMADVAAHHYWFLPVRQLLTDRFDSLSRIHGVGCPVLVIAGDRDTIVPLELSQRLFEAAPEPKRLITFAGVDHNDAELLAGDAFVGAITRALGEWLR
jgi:fermentation-respiration switch protein FrsA (DUF1100 family)